MTNESEQGSNVTDVESGNAIWLHSLDRFNSFSDGVFAIAITLLVLELPVPAEGVPVLSALANSWHEFLGYIISFAFIGSIWLTHSDMTKVMKRADHFVYGLNLILLLFVALLPFSTSLMVTHLDAEGIRIGVLGYGTNVLLASLSFSFLLFYVAREPGLVDGVIADAKLKRLYRRRWLVIGVNVLALFLAFEAPRVAVVLYMAMTTMLLVLPFLGLHRHKHATKFGK